MPVRRSTDPICLQHVWDAIRSANHQRQVADYTRIVRYLQRVCQCTVAQADLYITQCLDDDCIVAVQKTAYKGPKLGTQVESYKIPNELQGPPADGKDWYCIECHLAGDVNTCQLCHRVFHGECSARAKQKPNIFKSLQVNDIKMKDSSTANDSLNGLKNDEKNERLTGDNNDNNNLENKETETVNTIIDNDDLYNDKWCSLCNISKHDTSLGLEKEELNHLLSFILERIRSWLPDRITGKMAPDEIKHEWMTDAELKWRSNHLFFLDLDMSKIQDKITNLRYSTLFDFQKDVLTVQHNVAIFHGTESQEYGASELMLSDCIHDIKELINCVDCYKHSNEKINNNWFCLPCRKPHKLVWAKQKGYPYWPAKVIKETETTSDVRFFGGKYERSVLPKNCVKPITVSQDTLYIKRTTAFNKAYKQLLLHQKLLENPEDVLKIALVKDKSKTPLKPKKNTNVIKLTKRKSFDGSDIYEFHESPSDEAVTPPKRRHSSLPERSKQKPKLKRKSKTLDNNKHLDDDFTTKSNGFSFSFDDSEAVTNFTEECFNPKDSADAMQILEQPYSEVVEKMRERLEAAKDKQEMIKIAMDCMQMEIDRQMTEHNEHIRRLVEVHARQISETKKKQWCYYCEQDAIYHCCWNTAYCSQICQQQHWQAEHKKVCRRKR